ncbi:hypothetical protein NBRC116492_02940 [Aurantivibrio infirmus]
MVKFFIKIKELTEPFNKIFLYFKSRTQTIDRRSQIMLCADESVREINKNSFMATFGNFK